MLYFAQDGIVAVSDSVFVLTEIRRQLGIPNRVNISAALSRAWVHGMASQLLGTSTLVDGISYCPPGSKICIALDADTPKAHIEKISAPDLFLSNVADYRDTIRESAKKIASIIATLTCVNNTNTILSLSGGLDSRICLAAGLEHGARDLLYFNTNSSQKTDYPIALALGKRFGFDFKVPHGQKVIPQTEQLPAWFLSCAGIYDPLVGSRAMFNPIRFTIGGGGAEVYKGNFGWRTLSAIRPDNVGHVSSMRPAIDKYRATVTPPQSTLRERFLKFFQKHPKVERDIAEAAYREASEGLRSVGIAPEDPWASEWHYLCFRNAIHFGRGTMTSIAPLMQSELVGLSRSPLNAYPVPKADGPSIVTDLLIVLHPELALMPFDAPQKNMSSSYVEERSKFLGRITRVEPYSIIGDPYAVNSETPRIFLKLAAARGFEGQFTPHAVQEFVARGYEYIPKEIKHAYRMLNYLVENELPTSISASAWPCTVAGRIMSFILTD